MEKMKTMKPPLSLGSLLSREHRSKQTKLFYALKYHKKKKINQRMRQEGVKVEMGTG